MNTLYLVRGIPGSGKSAFVQVMFPGIFHVENDMWHMRNGDYKWSYKNMKDAISWCSKTVDLALAEGMDVVVSNTFTKCAFILRYNVLAQTHGAKFKVYRCIGDFSNIHHVPSNIVSNFASSMEDWPGEKIVDPLWVAEQIKQKASNFE